VLAGAGPVPGEPAGEGLRIGEALGLRHEDLSLRRTEVRVVPRDDNANEARVKRMKERAVPVRDVVLDLYADYMELEYGMLDCDYVLVTLSGPTRGGPMTRHGAGKLFSRLRQRTGIGHLHAHAYRHGYATRLLRAGVPAAVVAELLGHSSSQTTTETYSNSRELHQPGEKPQVSRSRDRRNGVPLVLMPAL
jgi:integrase